LATIVTTVTREITLEVQSPGDGPSSVPVVLSYASDDPWAVHATFLVGQDQQVVWLFSRELLETGRRFLCGDGDVNVGPHEEGRVRIELRSPDGTAGLLARERDVTAFLQATYDAVPAGAEHGRLDWDAQLDVWTRPQRPQRSVPPTPPSVG
jgi:hypothetical protein